MSNTTNQPEANFNLENYFMSRHDYDLHPIDAPDFDLAEWMWCTKWCKENGLSPYDTESWAKAKEAYKAQGENDE